MASTPTPPPTDTSFQRWLSACTAAFPSRDSIPWRRRPHRHPVALSVNEHHGHGADSQPAWTPHPETEQERALRLRAEKWAVSLRDYSPMIRFLSRHLALLSCNPYEQPDQTYTPSTDDPVPATAQWAPISPLGKIVFCACAPDRSGGFQPMEPPTQSGIVICSNRITSKANLEEVLAHEMVHWWDHCRFNVNWTNVRHTACSEIRASTLSGECSFWSELKRGAWRVHPKFLKGHQACARRRAITSLTNSSSLSHIHAEAERRAAAERAVDEVWEACWSDTRPFDEIY